MECRLMVKVDPQIKTTESPTLWLQRSLINGFIHCLWSCKHRGLSGQHAMDIVKPGLSLSLMESVNIFTVILSLLDNICLHHFFLSMASV